MIDFIFQNPAKIIFGKTSINYLEEELKDNNVKNMLVLSSGDYIYNLGIYDEILKVVKNLNINIINENKIVPNPQLTLVRELIVKAKENDIDFILAIGGGSVIDTAKAISVGINSKIDIWEYFTNGMEITETVPVGVISTLPASGSETSNCSIISHNNLKLGIESNNIIPKFAIINPEYTLNLPKYQTGCGIVDITTHLLERYFTMEENVDLTDYLIEGALKSVINSGYEIIENPKNYNARANMFLASIIAHNNSLEMGRIPDWASHRIEHELSATYNIAHGEGMAIVIPAYIRYMSTKSSKKFAQLANRLFNVDYFNNTLEKMANILADEFEMFYKKLGIKTKLSELNITDEKFLEMALNATKNDTNKIGHYIPIGSSEIVEILKLCL